MARTNPFNPHSPVNPGMFAGRIHEINGLEAALRQTRAGRPRNFLLTGERGIGKTSLLEYLRFVATGRIDADGDKFNFLVVTTDIEHSTSRVGLVRRLERELERALGRTEKARKYLAEIWQVIRRFEVAGVKLRDATQVPDQEALVDELAHSLAETTKAVTDPSAGRTFGSKFDGVLVVLDECDKASPSLALGGLLKLLLERVQRSDCANFMLCIAGLPSVREVLHESHQSSLRLFDEYLLERLSPGDCRFAVNACLEEANRQNVLQTSITEEGLATLIHLCEGYPHFVQQMGYCAFDKDADQVIDPDDVIAGATGQRGAIEQIGNRYYRNDFYEKIQKDSYRQVLRIMASRLDGWISKDEIRSQLSGSETTLKHALHALRTRNIIQDKEGERGVYRLANKAFAWWIRLQNNSPHQLTLLSQGDAPPKSPP